MWSTHRKGTERFYCSMCYSCITCRGALQNSGPSLQDEWMRWQPKGSWNNTLKMINISRAREKSLAGRHLCYACGYHLFSLLRSTMGSVSQGMNMHKMTCSHTMLFAQLILAAPHQVASCTHHMWVQLESKLGRKLQKQELELVLGWRLK